MRIVHMGLENFNLDLDYEVCPARASVLAHRVASPHQRLMITYVAKQRNWKLVFEIRQTIRYQEGTLSRRNTTSTGFNYLDEYPCTSPVVSLQS